MNRAIELAIALGKADFIVVAIFGTLTEYGLKVILAERKVPIVKRIQACTVAASVTAVRAILTTWAVFGALDLFDYNLSLNKKPT